MERSGNSVAIYVVTYFMFSKVQGIRDQITIVPCAEKIISNAILIRKNPVITCVNAGAHYIIT